MAQKQPIWRQRNRRRLIIGGIIIGCLCVIILMTTESMLHGTGFDENITKSISRTIISTTPTSIATPTSITTTEQYQPGKTLWDWMQLLIIPVVLAVAAYLFNLATSHTEHKIAEDKQRRPSPILPRPYV